MTKKVFTKEEEKKIKAKITAQAKTAKLKNVDVEKAYKRLEYILDHMSEKARQNFFAKACEFVRPKYKLKDHLACYALKIDLRLGYNMVIKVSQYGDIEFPVILANKDQQQLQQMKANGDTVWTRDELDAKVEEFLKPDSEDENQ